MGLSVGSTIPERIDPLAKVDPDVEDAEIQVPFGNKLGGGSMDNLLADLLSRAASESSAPLPTGEPEMVSLDELLAEEEHNGRGRQDGEDWDRGFWHSNDLHQCIADFAAYRRPDLNIVDAYHVMKRNGPRGVSVKDVVTMKAQLISTDMVAIDTAAAKLFGTEPEAVRYIQLAADKGVGRKDLENLKIKKIAV